jgi:nitrite reductase/ring-hydroxylating ferredoxin subunit
MGYFTDSPERTRQRSYHAGVFSRRLQRQRIAQTTALGETSSMRRQWFQGPSAAKPTRFCGLCPRHSVGTAVLQRPRPGTGLPIGDARLISAAGKTGESGGEMAWMRAAAVSEVKERGVMDAEVGGEDIALYWVDDAVFATHNICTHAFARLSEGFLEGDCIECPIHQAMFNVKTGEVMAPPAYTPIKTFPCRVEGDDVMVDV